MPRSTVKLLQTLCVTGAACGNGHKQRLNRFSLPAREAVTGCSCTLFYSRLRGIQLGKKPHASHGHGVQP